MGLDFFDEICYSVFNVFSFCRLFDSAWFSSFSVSCKSVRLCEDELHLLMSVGLMFKTSSPLTACCWSLRRFLLHLSNVSAAKPQQRLPSTFKPCVALTCVKSPAQRRPPPHPLTHQTDGGLKKNNNMHEPLVLSSLLIQRETLDIDVWLSAAHKNLPPPPPPRHSPVSPALSSAG